MSSLSCYLSFWISVCEKDKLRGEIKDLEIEKLTPLEALNKLNELKKKERKKDNILMFYNFSFGLVVFVLLSLLLGACKDTRTDDPEMKKYIDELIKERKEKDYGLQFDINSPFNRDTTVTFKPLNYYEPNPEFIFKSRLIEYDIQDTVQILGTKGETRPTIVLGYVELAKDNKVHKINVYKSFDRTGSSYYSIWFTDRTTAIRRDFFRSP